jgi:hypothetical protein
VKVEGRVAHTFNTKLGMAPGTSPAIAVSANGTYQVAFQNDGHTLRNFTLASGGVPTGYAMMAGTSPSVAAMPTVGFEIAFQANTGQLYTQTLQAGGMPRGVAVTGGTSPTIAQ